jgi:hypothetical protein
MIQIVLACLNRSGNLPSEIRVRYSTVILHCQHMSTNLSRLQRETKAREINKQRKAHNVLITAILLPRRLNCY